MFGFNFFKRKKKNPDTPKKEQQQKNYPLKSNKPVCSRYEYTNDRYSGGNDYGGGRDSCY